MLNNARFSKTTNFGDNVFISSAAKEDELSDYATLCKICTALDKKFPEAFNPIYVNTDKEYATIRFKARNDGRPPRVFTRGSKYQIEFNVKKKTNAAGDKVYVNAYTSKVKITHEAAPYDEGEVLDLGL